MIFFSCLKCIEIKRKTPLYTLNFENLPFPKVNEVTLIHFTGANYKPDETANCRKCIYKDNLFNTAGYGIPGSTLKAIDGMLNLVQRHQIFKFARHFIVIIELR